MQPITYTILNQVPSADLKTITIFFSFSDGSEASQTFPIQGTDFITVMNWANDRVAFLTQRRLDIQAQLEKLQEDINNNIE